MPSWNSGTGSVNDSPTPEPGPSIAEAVARYRPYKADPEAWARVGDFVRACVLETEPSNAHQARLFLRSVTPFVLWCEADGCPLDREEVFTPDNIERYVDYGAPELAATSRNTRRAHLRRTARVVTRRAPWPEPPTSLPFKGRPAPYSQAEIDGYASLTQPTPILQHRLDAALALGLGAGLWGREFYLTTGRQVRVDQAGITFVDAAGARARRIPVREQYAAEVRRIAAAVGDGPLLGGAMPRSDASRLWHLLQYLAIPDWLPPLAPERLRSTWLVHQLDQCVPTPAFLEAAGLKGHRSIDVLLPYLRRPGPDEAAALLAGISR